MTKMFESQLVLKKSLRQWRQWQISRKGIKLNDFLEQFHSLIQFSFVCNGI